MAICSLGSGGRVPRSRLSRPSLAASTEAAHNIPQGFLSRFGWETGEKREVYQI